MKVLALFTGYYLWLAFRYFLLAGGMYLWAKNKKGAYQKVRPGQVRREIKHSLISFIVFSLVGMGMITAMENGYTQIYLDVRERGLTYLIASIFGMLLFHDIYFYFTHRWMHEVKWLKKFHRIHHESVHTTPLSSFSFHPVEAFIETGVGIIFLFIVPLHPIAFFVFQLVMIGFNIIGHVGFDLFPKKTQWISTGSTHSLHHLKAKGNYGLYTTFWDALFGTRIPEIKTIPVHYRKTLDKPGDYRRNHPQTEELSPRPGRPYPQSVPSSL